MSENKWLIVVFLLLSFIAKVVVVPIFLAVFLAMLLEPVVKSLMKLNISRPLASTSVICATAVFAALLGWLAYTAALEISAALPTYVGKINELIAKVGQLTAKLSPAVSSTGKAPEVSLRQYPQWTSVAFSGLSSLIEGVSLLLFVPLLMFYFLIDKENLLESFNVLSGRYLNLPKLNYELPRMLRVFFAANLVTGAFLVGAGAILFFFMGFENWITLALVSGFLNLLPVVGGALAIAAPLLLGVGVTLTLPLVITLVGIVAGLHFLANNLVVPLLVGSRLNINAVALIIGLLFWSWVWGVSGFFLAVPMTALVKILLECNKDTIAFANIMASKPKRVLSGRGSPAPEALLI